MQWGAKTYWTVFEDLGQEVAPRIRGIQAPNANQYQGHLFYVSSLFSPSTLSARLYTPRLYPTNIIMFRTLQRHAARQLHSLPRNTSISRSYAAAHTATQPFDWKDPLGTSNLFTEEELAIAETAESYCQEKMQPRVLGKCYSHSRLSHSHN